MALSKTVVRRSSAEIFTEIYGASAGVCICMLCVCVCV